MNEKRTFKIKGYAVIDDEYGDLRILTDPPPSERIDWVKEVAEPMGFVPSRFGPSALGAVEVELTFSLDEASVWACPVCGEGAFGEYDFGYDHDDAYEDKGVHPAFMSPYVAWKLRTAHGGR